MTLDHESPGSVDNPKRILIVMDALKEFSMELFEWVLRNFMFLGYRSIILLGITPWLNIPLSTKTGIWAAADLLDLSSAEDKAELMNDPKYQKIQQLIKMCRKYGVDKPEIRTGMGHPLRLLVAEQISSLEANLVVFDKHHDKKYIEYYAEKIPCNMVVVNNVGEVNLIKKRNLDDDSIQADDTPNDYQIWSYFEHYLQ